MKRLIVFLLLINAARAQVTSYGNMVSGFSDASSPDGTQWITIVDPVSKQSYRYPLNQMGMFDLATYFTPCELRSIVSGSDMTDEINAALADSDVKGLVMDTKSGTDITISGTITVPAGKYLVFNGNRITGTGTISGGTIVAYPDQQIFGSNISLSGVKTQNGVIYPEWFGAVAGDGTDDITAIQKAADYVSTNTSGVKILEFSVGEYRISKGINFYKANGIEYDPINVWVRGRNTSQLLTGSFESLIRLTSDSSFAINIQEGKGCIIENLGIIGTNALTYTAAQVFNPASTFVLGNQSTNRFSPQAGIVFDAFGAGVAEGNRYKDFTSYYTNTSNGGSTTCIVRNVSIFNVVVGIVMSPNGSTQNNEGHHFDRIWLANMREGISTTNGQERTLKITNLNCWSRTKTVFSNNVYGEQQGDVPMLDVVNIAGAIYQVMDFSAGVGQTIGSFNNIYCEQLYRIGITGSLATTFTNCQFYLYDVHALNMSPPSFIFYCGVAKALFEGCTIIYFLEGSQLRWPLNMSGRIQFVNCKLNNQIGIHYVNNTVYNYPDYDRTDFYALTGFVNKGNLISSAANFGASGAGSTKHFIPFGTEITTMGGGSGATLSNGWKAKQVRRSLSPLIKRIPLGSVSLTVSGDTATGTVASLANVTALNGLLVYSTTWTYSAGGATVTGGHIGRIASIDGSGVITMDKVIDGITTGSYTLYVEVLTTIDGWYIADLSSTTLSNVTNGSGAATLTNGGLYYIYGNEASFVTSSSSGSATINANNTGEGDRIIICPFEYEEYGFTNSDPLTNAFFPSGTFFTKGAFYRKINGTDDTYGWQCTKSGFKGTSMAPEFIEITIPPTP